MEENNLIKIKPIVLSINKNLLFLDFDDIYYIMSENKGLKIYTTRFDYPIITTGTLKSFENILPGNQFFRCHFSYIINLIYIIEYDFNKKVLILDNGLKVPVSRSGFAIFKEMLDTK